MKETNFTPFRQFILKHLKTDTLLFLSHATILYPIQTGKWGDWGGGIREKFLPNFFNIEVKDAKIYEHFGMTIYCTQFIFL